MATVTAPPQVSLKTILVATDFSRCTEPALCYAAALAREEKGKIFLAHVLPPAPTYPIPLDFGPLSQEGEAACSHMREALATPELAGIEHASLLEQGELWPVLESVIKDHSIDVVVIGTHGREGLTKLILGSVAEEVFRRSPCPVVTVGPHVAPSCLHEGRLRRVVFATDLSPGSLHALPYVNKLAEQHHAELTLVHALASAIPDAESGATTFVQREVDEAQAQLRKLVPAGTKTDVVVDVGIAAAIIVRVAEKQNASLIVMGLHQQSVFAAAHFPWSTAHRVVCDAHCPVLTVR
ncbi:MAG: universal stress protein [Acidobacteriia bacterium]|nr:universal stress protein [Terriglobia bacterium]